MNNETSPQGQADTGERGSDCANPVSAGDGCMVSHWRPDMKAIGRIIDKRQQQHKPKATQP